MSSLILVRPSMEYLDEIRSYRQEVLDHGGDFHGDSRLDEFEDISAWIEHCRLLEHKETIPRAGWVEADQYMLVREGEHRILGMIDFRHYLTDHLAEYGGHIGFAVRPSERRKGYAKTMLALCLERCREMGLDRVLLTCDDDNEGSRRAIVSCGGVFERTTDEDGQKLERYWITLNPHAIQ